MNMHTTLSRVHTPALPIEPCPAETWQDSPAAIGIIAAIVDLSVVAKRLETLRAQHPQLHETAEAASLVGHVTSTIALKNFARGSELRLAPSNGACAVSVLWDLLREIRHTAICSQLKDEGFAGLTTRGVTQVAADAAFDRREELDRVALSVEQAVWLAPVAGRA